MTVPQAPSPWFSLTLITSAIVFLLVYLGWQQWRTLPPVFEEIPAGDARKTAFFAYLTPLVNQANAQVQKDRDRLAEVEQRLQNPLIRKGERRWLSSLALEYREPHIEPTTEMLRPWKPLDLLNIVYVHSKDYQRRLFTVLDDFATAGRITILGRRRLSFASSISNDGFVIAWEPRLDDTQQTRAQDRKS